MEEGFDLRAAARAWSSRRRLRAAAKAASTPQLLGEKHCFECVTKLSNCELFHVNMFIPFAAKL